MYAMWDTRLSSAGGGCSSGNRWGAIGAPGRAPAPKTLGRPWRGRCT